MVEKSLSKSTINFDQGHYKQSPLVGSGNTEKRKVLHEDDDSDSTISCKNSAKKRRRIIYSSEEDDDDVLNEPVMITANVFIFWSDISSAENWNYINIIQSKVSFNPTRTT